jgi:branched-chain amino acid transport system ATP-binding protein
MSEQTILNVSAVNKRFGGVEALSDVSFSVSRGEIHGLIGSNGAGKTTLFNLITGMHKPDSGGFELAGRPYLPSAPHEAAEAGIGRTFQNIRLFGLMTALENVMVGCHVRSRNGALGAVLHHRAAREEESAIRERTMALLDFVGIAHLADRHARQLSYGEQRRLELARALATDPQLLALDELVAGMNAVERNAMRELVLRIRDLGTTVLLSEHDVKFIMKICDCVTVLDHGKLIANGVPDEVKNDTTVLEAYLIGGGTRDE